MLIPRNDEPFSIGYTSITEIDGKHSDMLMDFGILRVEAGSPFKSAVEKERAFLLMNGGVTFEWSFDGKSGSEKVARGSLLDEEPIALHVPSGAEVTISADTGVAELAVQRTRNPKRFTPKVWKPGEYRSDRFGAGTMQDTSTRTVRTIFDAATAPESAMVLGEVINHPGKWSSYPPHTHAQPEIYHFRFFPQQGFGFSEQGDDVFKVKNADTVTIPPNVTHPQTAGPGYAMYYIWLIPHLQNDRFGPDSRIFVDKHEWVMDSKAPIWPDVPLEKVLEHQKKVQK